MVRVLSSRIGDSNSQNRRKSESPAKLHSDESPGKIEGERRSEIVNKRKRRNVKLVIKGALSRARQRGAN